MASDMTSAFRDFALKKLNEAKQKGATLATVTAATAASISSSVQVPGPTAFVFRGNGNREQLTTSELSVDKKIAMLKDANGALKQAARQHPSETLEASLYKMELINESLAFTIGNVQECSHMMKMMHRQFRDLGSMQQSDDRFFYRKDRGRNAMHASSTTTTTLVITNFMLKMTRRGVFVLFEGVDRCGKTTQTKLLQETLQQSGRASSLLHFPDRSTAIGQSINAYLTTTQAMDDRAIHLLFAANRWEAAGKIEDLLKSGVNIVMDRYSFSGVAFSAAKPGMTIDWCWQPEVGLPKPDTVIFLDIPVEKASKRADFGQERYETTAFQEQVYKNFYEIMASETPAWHVLDATETIEQVHARVLALTEQCIEANATKPLTYFQKRA